MLLVCERVDETRGSDSGTKRGRSFEGIGEEVLVTGADRVLLIPAEGAKLCFNQY